MTPGDQMPTGKISVAEFWRLALWALVVCTYLYLVVHICRNQGVDFKNVYLGPNSLREGVSPYQSTSHLPPVPYIFPPGAPVLLSPLIILSQHYAWFLFATLSTLLLPSALGWIVHRQSPRLPWLTPLTLLGVALFYPYQEALSLGNVDLLCAGLVLSGLAMSLDSSHTRAGVLGGILVGVAIAIKPTLWPVGLVVLVMVPMAARIGLIAAALIPTAIGLAIVPGTSRFFDFVLPYLSNGESSVGTPREALGDLARSVGVPGGAVTTLSLVLTALLTVGLVAWSFPATSSRVGAFRFAALGPVVPLALLMAPYGFLPYSVYLIVALPFALVSLRRWSAVAAGVGVFAIGAIVVLRVSGSIDGLLQWRFLFGLAILLAVTAVGLVDRLNSQPVIGLIDAPRPASGLGRHQKDISVAQGFDPVS